MLHNIVIVISLSFKWRVKLEEYIEGMEPTRMDLGEDPSRVSMKGY